MNLLVSSIQTFPDINANIQPSATPPEVNYERRQLTPFHIKSLHNRYKSKILIRTNHVPSKVVGFGNSSAQSKIDLYFRQRFHKEHKQSLTEQNPLSTLVPFAPRLNNSSYDLISTTPKKRVSYNPGVKKIQTCNAIDLVRITDERWIKKIPKWGS